DIRDAVSYALKTAKINLRILPPSPAAAPPPDPKVLAEQEKQRTEALKTQGALAEQAAEAQATQQETAQQLHDSDIRAHEHALDSEDEALERQSREDIAQ